MEVLKVKVDILGIHLHTTTSQVSKRQSWGVLNVKIDVSRFGHPLTNYKWPGTRSSVTEIVQVNLHESGIHLPSKSGRVISQGSP